MKEPTPTQALRLEELHDQLDRQVAVRSHRNSMVS